MVIQPLGDKEVYLITNVYGPQKPRDKLRLLTSLEDLRVRHSGIPWILGGDFNMIRSLSERKCGTLTYCKKESTRKETEIQC